MIRSLLVVAFFLSPVLSSAQDLRFRMDCGIALKTSNKPVKNAPFLRVIKTPIKGADGKWTQKYTLEETNTSTGAVKSFAIESAGSGDEDYNEFYVKGSQYVKSAVIQNNFRWASLSTIQDGQNECEPSKASYKCDAPANPNRGFKTAFSVEVKGERPGAEIIVTAANGKKQVVGKVTSLSTVFKKQGAPFQNIIGLISEEDISGVKQIDEVDRIETVNSRSGEQEVLVIRLFVNKTQIGGTFLINMMGTACLN
ncbi:MAG: hypothetical protein K2X47_18355 [Bdellovibrionales bacterium]|nr:hypothetical protein [Bdellovibrionales bacterium]